MNNSRIAYKRISAKFKYIKTNKNAKYAKVMKFLSEIIFRKLYLSVVINGKDSGFSTRR